MRWDGFKSTRFRDNLVDLNMKGHGLRERIEEMLRLAGSNARAGADEFLERLHSAEKVMPILSGSWYSPALRRSISEFFRHPNFAGCLPGIGGSGWPVGLR